MPYQKLTAEAINAAIADLPGWSVSNGKLHREFRFPDFPHAIGFMATAAPAIEKMNHHPEWANVYNRITIDLVTHDAQGITDADVRLAQTLEKLAERFL